MLGQHTINLKCMYDDFSEADVFYTTRIVWAIFPPTLIFLCVLSWILIFRLRPLAILVRRRCRRGDAAENTAGSSMYQPSESGPGAHCGTSCSRRAGW